MRRILLIGLVLVVAGVIAPVVATYVRNERLGDELVADVNAVATRRQRPLHRQPPLAGTFEECAAPIGDAVLDGGSLFAAANAIRSPSDAGARAELSSVLDGGLAYREMSESLRADAMSLESWARHLANCTRAPEIGGEVDGMGPFSPMRHPRDAFPLAIQTASKASMLGVRRALQSGEVGSLEVCSDVLALARDAQLSEGLMGDMVAVSVVRIVLVPCAEALAVATQDERRAFLAQLAATRAALQSFGAVLLSEKAQMQLLGYAVFLSPQQRGALPPSVRPGIGEWVGPTPKGTAMWALWFNWGSYVDRYNRMIAAANGPDRDAVLESIQQEDSILERLGYSAFKPVGYGRFARRHDGIARGFDLLESVARLSEGEAAVGQVVVREQGGLKVLSIPWFEAETISVTVGPAAH